MFINISIEKCGSRFHLIHTASNVVIAELTRSDLTNLQKSNATLSKSEIKGVRTLVNEVKAVDAKSKLNSVLGVEDHRTGFHNDMEYIIASKVDKLSPELTGRQSKELVKGLRALSDFGYIFSNQEDIVGEDGQVKHSAGRIKFHSSNISFSKGKITLRDREQVKQLCIKLAKISFADKGLLLTAISEILSEDTKIEMQDIMRERPF